MRTLLILLLSWCSFCLAGSAMENRCTILNHTDTGGPMWSLKKHDGNGWKNLGEYTSGTEAYAVLEAMETMGKCSKGSINANLLYRDGACPACPREQSISCRTPKCYQWGEE